MRYLLSIIIILCLTSNSWGHPSTTNRIEQAIKYTYYSAKPLAVASARRNHDGNELNCIQYCFRIKDIVPTAKIYEVGGKHAIVEIIDENGKTITYSNGKQVKAWAYQRVRQVK